MEERLSQEDIQILEYGIEFNHRFGIRILKVGMIMSVAVSIGLFMKGGHLIDALIMFIGVMVFTILSRYYAFGRSKSLLKQDLQKGTKTIETATINKIKKGKEGRVYKLSNGLEVTDLDLAEDDVKMESIKIGQQMIIALTPHRRLILNIKEIK